MSRVNEPLNDNARAQLSRDLPREAIKTRSQAGQSLSYVDSVYVIDQLNAVFGPDGWSATYGAPVIRDGERPTVYVPCELRAAGVTRGDVGVGLAASAKPDAFETAIKSAYTDGLKRCARTFGARLGLALYDKSQEAVGYSLVAQDVIDAFERAADPAAYDAARNRARTEWSQLADDERNAVRRAQERAAERVDAAGSSQTAPAPAAPAPGVQLACARIALARSSRTVVAALLACDARGTAAAPLDAAIAARRAAGVDLGDVEAVLGKARTVTATPAQWNDAAGALAAFDGAADAAALNAARKTHAAAIVALPEALRSGVKAAADARAAALGAPTAASVLLGKAKAARSPEDLTALHAELTAAVEGRRITTKTEVEAITQALNTRAEELTERAAMAAA